MNICHVIDNLFLDRGGPVAVVSGLGREQAGRGHRVTVLCRSISRSAEERKTLRHIIGDRVEFVSLDSTPGGLRACLHGLRPDILHLHAVWEPILRRAASWGRRNGVPWVVSSHGLLHPDALRKGYWKKQAYLRLLGGFVVQSRHVFALNQEECLHIHHVLGANAEIMPNGVDESAIRSARPEAFFEAFPSLPTDSFILGMGRVHPVKGFDQLVRCYALARQRAPLPDLVIVGPGDRGEAEVLNTARRLGVSRHVHLPGAAYGSLRFSALHASRMLVHRPRYEGFGMIVAEAVSAGRPVVTTRVTGLAREAPAGLLHVAQDTDEHFAEMMIKTLRDAPASEAMAREAQAWINREFAWSRLASRIEDAYRSERTPPA